MAGQHPNKESCCGVVDELLLDDMEGTPMTGEDPEELLSVADFEFIARLALQE